MSPQRIGDATLYLADWRDLDLPQVDHVITDPPYSKATHVGHAAAASNDAAVRADLGYEYLGEHQASAAAARLGEISLGWVVWMTDHHLVPIVSSAFKDRYVFAPLPFVAPGSRVRLAGDGPSSWTIWIVVSRPAALSKWGTLPGAYIAKEGWREREYIGGKPLQLMMRIVDDYSRRGDTILDPYMGSGTTGVAALRSGRRFIGVEIDPAAFDQACERIDMCQRQADMFA